MKKDKAKHLVFFDGAEAVGASTVEVVPGQELVVVSGRRTEDFEEITDDIKRRLDDPKDPLTLKTIKAVVDREPKKPND